MNYESARGMYEAYGRNKYDALGITTWKYDAAWPAAMTWQYVDWYLNVGGAYYGAKKACEPLHIQYSYDDHSVVVVNNYYKNYDGLHAFVKIYNMDMTEKYNKSARINVKSDGKSEVLKIEWPDELSKTFFLSLKLKDIQGQLISDNLYWLSTTADVQGSKEHIRTDKGWGILKAKPKSFADFTGLNDLQKVKLDTDFMLNVQETVGEIDVSLKNPADKPAFMIVLAVKDKEVVMKLRRCTGRTITLPYYRVMKKTYLQNFLPKALKRMISSLL